MVGPTMTHIYAVPDLMAMRHWVGCEDSSSVTQCLPIVFAVQFFTSLVKEKTSRTIHSLLYPIWLDCDIHDLPDSGLENQILVDLGLSCM
ncbi:hypothetical protein GDO81_022064 [Engystomops pustulosus]|uniref:Uncharacterized protein n=1 Tax=Engystomops pustulosus TaxID=76066 RepID=A0AAV6YUC3_ENGPU|nr:hypothetical protein GDO81_022064 [Engystomops pustulosus]